MTTADLNVRLEAMRARHFSTQARVMGRLSDVCFGCGDQWPCDANTLLAAVDAVVKVHYPDLFNGDPAAAICGECVVTYPCPTIRALTDAIGGGE